MTASTQRSFIRGSESQFQVQHPEGSFKTTEQGWEMSLLLKCLLGKPEDLSLDPPHPRLLGDAGTENPRAP